MANENRNNPTPGRDERDRDTTGGLHDAQRKGNLGNERTRSSGDDTKKDDTNQEDALEDNLGNERGRDKGYLGKGRTEI